MDLRSRLRGCLILHEIDYQPRGRLCTLDVDEVALCIMIARKRTYENRNVPHVYKSSMRLQPQPVAELAACCCEMAVARTLNRYWHGLVWLKKNHETNRKKQDVGSDIEVKRIVRPTNPLRFRQSDVDADRMMFLTYCLGVNPDKAGIVYVDIIGFGRAAKLQPFAQKDDDLFWSVDQSFLTPFV